MRSEYLYVLACDYLIERNTPQIHWDRHTKISTPIDHCHYVWWYYRGGQIGATILYLIALLCVLPIDGILMHVYENKSERRERQARVVIDGLGGIPVSNFLKTNVEDGICHFEKHPYFPLSVNHQMGFFIVDEGHRVWFQDNESAIRAIIEKTRTSAPFTYLPPRYGPCCRPKNVLRLVAVVCFIWSFSTAATFSQAILLFTVSNFGSYLWWHHTV